MATAMVSYLEGVVRSGRPGRLKTVACPFGVVLADGNADIGDPSMPPPPPRNCARNAHATQERWGGGKAW